MPGLLDEVFPDKADSKSPLDEVFPASSKSSSPLDDFFPEKATEKPAEDLPVDEKNRPIQAGSLYQMFPGVWSRRVDPDKETQQEIGKTMAGAGMDVKQALLTTPSTYYKGGKDVMMQQAAAEDINKKAMMGQAGVSPVQDPFSAAVEQLPLAGRVLEKGAGMTTEMLPQMALSAIPGVGPELSALSFGYTPEGFDPAQAAIMLAAPEVGGRIGQWLEKAAKKSGVEKKLILEAVNKLGGATSAAAALSAPQLYEVSKLPPGKERDKAASDMMENFLAVFAMDMAGRMGEEKGHKMLPAVKIGDDFHADRKLVTHDMVEEDLKKRGVDTAGHERGFVDVEDPKKFLTREEAAKVAKDKWGVEAKQEEGKLHSEDLIREGHLSPEYLPESILKKIKYRPLSVNHGDVMLGGKRVFGLQFMSEKDHNETMDKLKSVGGKTVSWSGVNGYWMPDGKGSGTIFLKERTSESDPIFTHELVHGLRDTGIISKSQWEKLVDGYRQGYGKVSRDKILKTYANQVVEGYTPEMKDMTADEIKQLEVEGKIKINHDRLDDEVISHVLQDWHENGVPKEFNKNWFHTVRDFVKGLWDRRDATAKNPHEVMHDVISGKFEGKVSGEGEKGVEGIKLSKKEEVEPHTLATVARDNPKGFMIDMKTGEHQKTGYVVAPSKLTEHIVDDDKLNEAGLRSLLRQHRDLAEKSDHNVFMGGWLRDDGKFVFDVPIIVDNLHDALHIARNGQQDGIFHLDKNEYISTKDGIEKLKQDGLFAEEKGPELAGIRRQFDSIVQGQGHPEAGREQQPAYSKKADWEDLKWWERSEYRPKVGGRERDSKQRTLAGNPRKLIPGEVDGNVAISHWSAKPRESIDPKYYGSGIVGEEGKRRTYKKLWVNRSYYGLDGYSKESGLGRHRHDAKIDAKKLYDFHDDPDDLRPKAIKMAEKLGDGGQQSIATALEKILKDSGYLGYYDPDHRIAAVFHPVEPNRVVPGQKRATPMFSLKSEGEELTGIRRETIERKIAEHKLKWFPRGIGASTDELLNDGRRRLLDGEDPNDSVERFRKTGSVNDRDFALLRATVEVMEKAADEAYRKHGSADKETIRSKKDFQKVVQVLSEMDLVWHKVGQAMQGEADLNLASPVAVKLAAEKFRKRPLSAKESEEGDKYAKAVDDATKKVDEPLEQIKKMTIEGGSKIPTRVEALARRIIEIRDSRKARALKDIQALREASGMLFSKVEGASDVPEEAPKEQPKEIPKAFMDRFAEVGGIEILDGFSDRAAWDEKMIENLGEKSRPHLDKIWEASQKAAEEMEREELKHEPMEVKRDVKKRVAANKETDVAGREDAAVESSKKKIIDLDAEKIKEEKKVKDAQSARAKAEKRIESEKRRLEKKNAELEARIAAGEIEAETKPLKSDRPAAAPEIEKLKQRQDELKKIISDLRDKKAKEEKEAASKKTAETKEAAKKKASDDKVLSDALNESRVLDEKIIKQQERDQRNAAIRIQTEIARDQKRKNIAQAKETRDRLNKIISEAKSAEEKSQKELTRIQSEARAAEEKVISLESKRRADIASGKMMRGTIGQLMSDIGSHKAGQPFNANQVRSMWDYVRRNYIDKGETSLGDIRAKVAISTGLSVDDVTKCLSQNQGAKRLLNKAWRNQQVARRVKLEAQRWVHHVDETMWQRAIRSIPPRMFAMAVGFHGTVALGTHAPMVAFQPRFWGDYVHSFFNMYHMVFSPEYYEMRMENLLADKNFTEANRAGLANDPYKVEDFNNPDMAKYFGRFSGMGNRGYFVLKTLRQDMFNHHWEKLTPEAQTPEMAKAIADGINHATGVVKKGFGGSAGATFLFAPKLLASRAAWLVGDPVKSLGTFARWNKATPEEKFFAKQQVAEKLMVAGTMYSMLALNQGFLTATGSDQKINGIPEFMGGAGVDPMEHDFMKFKVAGTQLSYGNAMLNMAKLPLKVFESIKMAMGKHSRATPEESVSKIVEQFVRSQASPFAGTAADLLLGSDFEGRPIPRADFGLIEGDQKVPKRLRAHGIEPYTWGEYAGKVGLPIPFQEFWKAIWRDGLGMSDEQIKAYGAAFIETLFNAGTGGRMQPDISLQK